MIPIPWVAGGMTVALLVTGVTGYNLGYSARDDRAKIEAAKVQAEAARKMAEMTAELTKVSGEYEAFRQQQPAVRERAVNTIREVYRNVEVPAVCVPPDVAVRVLDAEVHRANAAAAGEP